MNYVTTPVSTPSPTLSSAPFGIEFLRGYTCKYIAKFPLPKNYWEAISNPNILTIPSESSYGEFFKSSERSKVRFKSVSAINIEGIGVFTNFERAQYMFVTSVIFRMLQIISIDLLNKIDTKKWNIFGKMIVSAVVLAAPYLFMSYVLGFPMHDLIGPTQLQNLAAFGLNYFSSTAWSNTLRELNVVSTTRNFHFRDGIFRGFLSSAINFVSTSLIQSYAFSTSTPMFIDDQASVSDCIKGRTVVRLTLSQKDAFFAEYITNELGWLVGRYAVDFSFAALNFLGVIKDLRTPFNVWQTSRPQVVAIPEKQEVVADPVIKAGQAKPRIQAKPMAKLDIDSAFSPVHYSSTMPLPQARVKSEHDGRIKVKTRPAPEVPVVPAVPVNPKLDVIETNGSGPMVRLYGNGVAPDTWGIVSNKIEDRSFERSLRSGHVHPGAAIQTVGPEIFELRPAGTDKRSLAEPVKPYDALRRLLPLGEAIAVDQVLAANRYTGREIKIVPFERVVRHGSNNVNIAREIARIDAERRAREAVSRVR